MCSPHASGFSQNNSQAMHEFQTVPNPFIFRGFRQSQIPLFLAPPRPRKIILNTFCSFTQLINVRNKKMKSWSHLSSPTIECNQQPSTMLPHYSPAFPTSLPSHIFSTFLAYYPPNFSTFHLLSSAVSHLSQLTILPVTNKSFQNSNVPPFGRHEKRV